MRPIFRAFLIPVAAPLLVAAPLVAFTPEAQRGPLADRAIPAPELRLNTSLRPLEEVPEGVDHAAWDRFFRTHGEEVRVFIDTRSGTPAGVIGPIPLIPGPGAGNRVSLNDLAGRLGEPVDAVDAAVVAAAVRHFVATHADALGIDVGQLGTASAQAVRDGLWQVSIPQVVDGVPVRRSRIAATLVAGNLVLLGTEAWGNAQVDTHPALNAAQARARGFAHAGGRGASDREVHAPHLEVVPFAPPEHQVGDAYVGPVGAGYGHRLVWTFSFRRAPDLAHWEVMVDAHGGQVVAFRDLTRRFSDRYVRGGVYPLTSTEACPTGTYGLVDYGRCGLMQPGYSMPYADTGLDPPWDFTAYSGHFYNTIGPVTTALHGVNAYLEWDGCGTFLEGPTTTNIELGGSTGDHDCDAPPGTSAGNTPAARTAYSSVSRLVDMARGWAPTSPIWQQSPRKIDSNGGGCGAQYAYNTLWLGSTTAECRNAGEIATIVDHEWGHSAGILFGNTGEGTADLVAVLHNQTSCLGYGFYSFLDSGCGLTSDFTGYNGNEANAPGAVHCLDECSGPRDADWAKHADQTPDTPLGFVCTQCYGGCINNYCNDAPIRQALWDLATRDLRAAPFFLDDSMAWVLTQKIAFQGSSNVGQDWYSCSCAAGTADGCGATNGYLQWLAADDDNGNLNDGTPHMTALYAAFDRHGIACPQPTPVDSGCAGAPTQTPRVNIASAHASMNLNWPAVPGAEKYWVLRTDGYAGCHTGKALVATVYETPHWENVNFWDSRLMDGHQYCYMAVPVGSSDACVGRGSPCVCTTPNTYQSGPYPTLFSESFSSGIPASWQVIDSSGGGASGVWSTSNPCCRSLSTQFSGSFAMLDAACYYPQACQAELQARSGSFEAPRAAALRPAAAEALPAPQDDQLVSPAINATGCAKPILEFSQQLHWVTSGSNEVADVDVSGDGGATWHNLLRIYGASDGYPTPWTRRVDLSEHAAGRSQVKVRFHYYDGGRYDRWWAIDNVKVTCESPTVPPS